MSQKANTRARAVLRDIRLAKQLWPKQISKVLALQLGGLIERHGLCVFAGDIQLLNGKWYVTHSGLLGLAIRHRCRGIRIRPVLELCDKSTERWAFKATVFKSNTCRGFVGYGDADPSNVSPLVRGAEMRMAETRAVNRALRKAYGIGICSVEEIGSLPGRSQPEPNVRKLPPQPVNGNGEPRLRDQLCLLIRQHGLDASLVKQYAAEFCSTKNLRQASREQVATFIKHIAEFATRDREALLVKLSTFAQQAGAA